MKSIYPNLVKILNREKITVMDVAMELCVPTDEVIEIARSSCSAYLRGDIPGITFGGVTGMSCNDSYGKVQEIRS